MDFETEGLIIGGHPSFILGANMSEIRRRGRPKGSEIPDAERLQTVAKMVFSKGLKPTTAMRKVAQENESIVRRLQRKWRIVGPKLLAKLQSGNAPTPIAFGNPASIVSIQMDPQVSANGSAGLGLIARHTAQAFTEASEPLQLLAQQFQENREDYAAIGRALQNGLVVAQNEIRDAVAAFQAFTPHLQEELRKAALAFQEFVPHVEEEIRKATEGLAMLRDHHFLFPYASR